MEFVVWVETRLAGRTLEVRRVASVSRQAAGIGAEDVGLTLAEGKDVIRAVQERVVNVQTELLEAAARPCSQCDKSQRVKDRRRRRIATVFGTVLIRCRRSIRCKCAGGTACAVWPLASVRLGRSTPELDYLVAKWGSRLPYRRAAALLNEFLPLAKTGNCSRLRPAANTQRRREAGSAGGRA